MQQAEKLSLEQIRAFLAGAGPVEFAGEDRTERYQWVEHTLRQQDYVRLGRADKGLLRRYIAKMTGLSRAQVTRLIGQYQAQGAVRPPVYQRRKFPSRYTEADIRLLAYVDQAHGVLSEPATKRILEREYQEFGQALYRTSGVDLGGADLPVPVDGDVPQAQHGVSVDAAHAGQHRRATEAHAAGASRLFAAGHGAPRRPRWNQGLYHINAVDEVTQWEIEKNGDRL